MKKDIFANNPPMRHTIKKKTREIPGEKWRRQIARHRNAIGKLEGGFCCIYEKETTTFFFASVRVASIHPPAWSIFFKDHRSHNFYSNFILHKKKTKFLWHSMRQKINSQVRRRQEYRRISTLSYMIFLDIYYFSLVCSLFRCYRFNTEYKAMYTSGVLYTSWKEARIECKL